MPAIVVLLIILAVVFGVLYNISPVLGIIASVALIAFIVYLAVVLIKSKKHGMTNNASNQVSSIGDPNIKKIFTNVAGVTYEDRQSILPTLYSGMPLELVREPNNFFDKNAIALYCNGKMIGYIKRDLAMGLAFLIDRGTRVEGKIVGITGGDGLSYGCNIELTIYR